MKNKRTFFSILIIVVFACLHQGAFAQSRDIDRASKVRAGLLKHMLMLVTWPESSFENDDSPFIIGFIGSETYDISDYLATKIKSHTSDNRRIIVKNFAVSGAADTVRLDEIIRTGELQQCKILFIDDNTRLSEEKILEAIKNHNVLTIGTTKSFPESGGIVAFTIEDDRIRIRINLETASREDLKISAKVLQHAIIVESVSKE